MVTAPNQTLWKYPVAGDTKGRRPQSVLSASSEASGTLNHSNSRCVGCGQQGSSAAEVFTFA